MEYRAGLAPVILRVNRGEGAPMTARHKPGIEIDRGALWLLAAPFVILLGSELLLSGFAEPRPTEAALALTYNEHLENAARLQIVAMALLIVGVGVGSSVYIFHQSRALAGDSRNLLRRVAAGLAMIGAAFLIYVTVEGQQTQELADQRLFCAAAQAPPLPTTAPAVPGDCNSARFTQVRLLLVLQRFGIFPAIIAIMLGCVVCLGYQAGRSRDDEDPAFLAEQIERLNMTLYLAAFTLVCGLLFLSAYLRYPVYALSGPPAANYLKAANAVVLFYGVSYSLFIASCYIPAASILSQRATQVTLAQSAPSSAGGALLTTPQLLKIGLAVLAPVITSLIGEVVKLSGI